MRSALTLGLVVLAACFPSSEDADETLGPCVADGEEPNEGFRTRRSLGWMKDDPGTSSYDGPQRIDRDLTLRDGEDIDWFKVEVVDSGIAGEPVVDVFVSDGELEVAAWPAGACDNPQCYLGTKFEDDPNLNGTGCSSVPAEGGGAIFRVAGCGDVTTIRVRAAKPVDTCRRYALVVYAE